MVRELFFGAHKPQLPFRYFRTNAVCDRAGVSSSLRQWFEKLEMHAEDVDGGLRYCHLLNGFMQQQGGDMDDYDAIDALCAFDDIFYRAPATLESLDEDAVLTAAAARERGQGTEIEALGAAYRCS